MADFQATQRSLSKAYCKVLHASIASSLFSCFGLNVSKMSLITNFGICTFYVLTVLRAKSYIHISVMNDY